MAGRTRARSLCRVGLAILALTGARLLAQLQLPAPQKMAAELAGPLHARQAVPAANHRGPLMQALEPLMVQQARYLDSTVGPWKLDPRASLLPREKECPPCKEDAVRPSAHFAKGLAIMCRLMPETSFPEAFPRRVARERALELIRFLVQSHGVAGGVCEDGKPWGGEWQSAYWAALAGEAAWLLWDDLSERERWLAATMICTEADRFVGVTPPARVRLDTKAEENAWNSRVISLAYNMFPQHPRHAVWRETAIRWMLSAYATTQDLARTDLVDGRPLREWITAANAHDDYTVENHRRVHPDYMVDTTLISSQVSMYAWAGNPEPAALRFNAEAVNHSLKRLAFPDGGWIYPNSQDWSLRLNADWLQYHVHMALLFDDRQSAALLRGCLEVMQRMAARTPQGSIYNPSEDTFASQQAMMLELPAMSYLQMARMGEGPEPVGEAQLREQLAGRHLFEFGQFALLRTTGSVATFSWGTQVMGLVFPLQKDLLIAPNPRGLVGYVEVPGVEKEAPVARQVLVSPRTDLFAVAGVIDRAGGALEQRFAFVALPDGRTVYADRVVLKGVVPPTRLDLGTLGVLNDRTWPYYHGRREVTGEGGTAVFAAVDAERAPERELPGRWFNLEGLGIVCLDLSGRPVYQPHPTGAPGRLEQLFHLNAVPAEQLASSRPGAVLAHSVLIFQPGQTVAATQASARDCTLQSRPGEARVRVTLEGSAALVLDLEQLTIDYSGATRDGLRSPSATEPAAVLALMERVADYHLAHPTDHPRTGWFAAAFYAGLTALAQVSDSGRFHAALMAMGEGNAWRVGPSAYDADDHAIAQTYLELYATHRDPVMIADTRRAFDFILAHPKDANLDYDRKKNPDQGDKWSWCDSLFMAPPAWVGLGRATGSAAYIDYATVNWSNTSGYLYDPAEHLFYRDSRFFTRREANGRKVFWSRGNGWVLAGLARVLELLPPDHPERVRFEAQFVEMSRAVAALQPEDGLWRASLLDPASYPLPETSGSGFFCYALAWGINRGLLPRAEFEPAVRRAWAGLGSCVTTEGRLTHVQPVGADPKTFAPESTEDYGVGAFLLAGREMLRLTGAGKPPAAPAH